MFREYIEEDNKPVIFETSKPVLFSIIKDGTFNKTWEPWTERHLELKDDSTMVYRKKKDKSIIKRLDLKNTNISKMALDVENNDNIIQDHIEKEVGIVVTCTINGYPTSFRCILNEYELHKFFTAVQKYVINPTVDADALTLDTFKKTMMKKRIIPSLITQSNNNDQQSFMRQSLMFAMDKYSRKTKHEQIRLRRGWFLFIYYIYVYIHVRGLKLYCCNYIYNYCYRYYYYYYSWYVI